MPLSARAAAGDPDAAAAIANNARRSFAARRQRAFAAAARLILLAADIARDCVTASAIRSSREATDVLAARGWTSDALRGRLLVAGPLQLPARQRSSAESSPLRDHSNGRGRSPTGSSSVTCRRSCCSARAMPGAPSDGFAPASSCWRVIGRPSGRSRCAQRPVHLVSTLHARGSGSHWTHGTPGASSRGRSDCAQAHCAFPRFGRHAIRVPFRAGRAPRARPQNSRRGRSRKTRRSPLDPSGRARGDRRQSLPLVRADAAARSTTPGVRAAARALGARVPSNTSSSTASTTH